MLQESGATQSAQEWKSVGIPRTHQNQNPSELTGRHTPTESSEDSPCPNPYQLKGYIATYNVSPGAPGPQNRGFEVERLWDLRALVEELKRVKDKGVIVSLMYNSETAIITVDAPGGL